MVETRGLKNVVIIFLYKNDYDFLKKMQEKLKLGPSFQKNVLFASMKAL